MPQAVIYRVQVAVWPTNSSDAIVFKHPLRTDLADGTSQSNRVVGAQVYY